MPNWLLKSALHRAISWLPRPQFWNGLLRRYGSRSLELSSSQFEIKLSECRRHWQEFKRHHPNLPADFTTLELGTGWFPIIPLGLYLCGAGKIWTVDIDAFLSAPRMRLMMEYFQDYNRTNRLREILPDAKPERIERLMAQAGRAAATPPKEWLAEFAIHPFVQDAQALPLSAQSVECFFSSGVLEYIPEPVLKNILGEFRRLAKPGAVMTHRLNLVDVYSYFDHKITTLNYLRFSDRQWRWLNSPLIWQSRLRVSDYRRLYHEAGFDVVTEQNESEAAEKLKQLPLDARFRGYAEADLLVIHSFMVGRLKTGG
jgi:hypothetical protein